jgi:hypothetical protein
MNKLVAIILSLVLAVTAALALAENGPGSSIKAGDAVYACGCGAGCSCGTMSNKAGKCGCGKQMVKTSVTKVEGGKAYYQMSGKEVAAPTTAKYACSCGSACQCGTISQKPGTCGCGMALKKVD